MLPPVLERLPAARRRPLLLRAGRHVPEPRAEPAPPREPRVHRREDARGGRRPRRRLRRRRRPLLLRRRHGRVRPRRLRHRAPRRAMLEKEPGREGHLRRARELGRAARDRGGRRHRRSSTASATRSSSSGCARRTPLFAGEVSAHYYFRDFTQADTGVVPFLLMLELLSREGAAALGAPRAVPRAVLHHRRDQHAGRGRRRSSSRRSRSATRADGGRISHLDGISVDFDDWHFNVRPSNTEPLLRLNLEAPRRGDDGAEARRGARPDPILTRRDRCRHSLQFDFPMAGPWGDEMAAAFGDLAGIIGRSPGLRWKIWTENEDEGTGGGIYLFEDDESARAYLEEHTARLEGFGVKDIRAKLFHVNEPLTEDHARAGRRLRWTTPGARPRHRPAAAVQVLGADARLVLRHGRAGRRLLRPLPAVLRPRADRVPPAPRHPRDARHRRRRVRHARIERRVPRAGPLRRPARVLRPRSAASGGRASPTSASPLRLPDDALMVTATQTLVLVDLETRRPTPIPEAGARADPRVRGRRPRGVSPGGRRAAAATCVAGEVSDPQV